MTCLMRAVEQETEFLTPLSISCHFLNVGSFAEATIEVVRLKQSKTRESFRVSMFQDGAQLVEALIWVGEEGESPTHQDLTFPDVKAPEELDSINEMLKDSPHTFHSNFDLRPTNASIEGIPRLFHWHRYVHESDWGNPFINVGRYLILLDTFGWASATLIHEDAADYIAPTISFNAEFYRPTDAQWLLSESWCPFSLDGHVTVQNRVWDRSGNPLAQSSGSLMCRRIKSS